MDDQAPDSDPVILHELLHGREYTDGLLLDCALADRPVDPPVEIGSTHDDDSPPGRTSPLMPTLLV